MAQQAKQLWSSVLKKKPFYLKNVISFHNASQKNATIQIFTFDI